MPTTRRTNTRSKSCGRASDKGLEITFSNSPAPNLPAPSARLSRKGASPPQPKQTPEEQPCVSTTPSEPDKSKKIDENCLENNDLSSSHVLGTLNSDFIQPPKNSVADSPPTIQVSDNGGIEALDLEALRDAFPPPKPGDPWFLAFQELKDIRTRVKTLDKIECSTELHTQQLSGIVQRTTELESTVGSATTKIKELNEVVSTLKSVVEQQGKTIQSLQHLDEDFKKLQSSKDQTKREILLEMEDRMDKKVESKMTKMEGKMEGKLTKISNECNHNSLKSQANWNKLNLVITGLKEDPSKDPLAAASKFLSSTLKIKDLELDIAYRLGALPPQDSGYVRPLVVRFTKIAHRDKVWKNKTDITEEDGQKIRIHADLPKRLRNDSQLLYRVQKAASGIPKFHSAKIRDYKLFLHGKEYAPNELENLPFPIRPSTLATPRSDTALVFFSRHSVFSIHHHSPFTVKGVHFQNMEQFLAYRKALFTEQDQLASQVLEMQDPAEAKSVLNRLKKSCPQQWYDQVPEIVAEGLKEKFRQNRKLLDALVDTHNLQMGEASHDTTWGIGMPLNDPQVLDQSKWHPKGNLLGRALMNIREELCTQGNPTRPKNKTAARN